MPHTTVLLTVTTGPTGWLAGCFLALAPGFTALTAFTDMSTTALIRIPVTLDQCRIAGRSASTTSTPTRREMDEETLATLAMTGRLSTRSRDIEVAGIPVGMAAGGARERADLGGRWLPLPLIFQDVIPNEVAPPSAVFRGWEPMQPASRGCASPVLPSNFPQLRCDI